MTNGQKNFLTWVFPVLLVIGISFYIYKDLYKENGTSETQKGVNQNIPVSIKTDQSDQNYKVEAVPVVETNAKKSVQSEARMPDLNLPVVNYSNIDDAAFKIASQSIGILVADIKKDPRNEDSWLNLGIFRKMLGDYSVSVGILNYVVALWPNDYVVYNNLADLYQFYIKNYPLAEKNWLKVVELNPIYIDAYTNLYPLYSDPNYKDKQSLARPILLKGLENNPKSIQLMMYLARHYKNLGDKNMATVYYNKAISEAKAQNNDQVASSIQSEAQGL